MPGIYDELSELIEKAQSDSKATTEHWSYYNINGKLEFWCKGKRVAVFADNTLTISRDDMESACLQREFLLKRLVPVIGTDNVVYKTLDGVDEVFITYNFKKKRYGVAHYATDSGIVRMPDGSLLKVYKHHSFNILANLTAYTVEDAKDAPEPIYAVKIKQCSKCSAPYLVRFKAAHATRDSCWNCCP